MNQEETDTKSTKFDPFKQSVSTIKPKDARHLLNQTPEAWLIDVRTKEEYSSGHIPGAVLIPLSHLETLLEWHKPDKSAPILVYCRSGHRVIAAIELLKSKGYETLYNLGGIIEWPYEIEKSK
jgi:rhodanese-related sulfurtransferase